jgi:hypothetical protein
MHLLSGSPVVIGLYHLLLLGVNFAGHEVKKTRSNTPPPRGAIAPGCAEDAGHQDGVGPEHKKSAQYKYYGDNEYDGMQVARGSTGVAAKDWANPGKQSNPTYDSVAGP